MKIISLPVVHTYLNKKKCLAEAERLLTERAIIGMSRKQLAEEIYFHALVYDISMRTGLLRSLRVKADPIDLEEGGDTLFRRICYRAVWTITRT